VLAGIFYDIMVEERRKSEVNATFTVVG